MIPEDVVGKFIKIKRHAMAYKRISTMIDPTWPYRSQSFSLYFMNTILLIVGYEFTINDRSHIMLEVVDSDMRTSLVECRYDDLSSFIEVL